MEWTEKDDSLMNQQTEAPEVPEVADISLRRSPTIGKLVGALALAQTGFQPIKKDTNNPYYGSKYADLANVIEATQPSLAKNGLVVMQFPFVSLGAKSLSLTTMLAHTSGEWIASDLTVPATMLGKDKTIKFDVQSIGSAETYTRRYAYQAIVGVAAEADDDGNAASSKTREYEDAYDQRTSGEQTLAIFQMNGIEELCKTHNKTEEQILGFLKTLGVDRIEKVLKRDFDKFKKWAIAPLDLTEPLQKSVDILKAKQVYPVQADFARLYASAGERGIGQEEIKQYYTRKYKVISGKELTLKQFKEVEAEVGTWKAPSILVEAE